MKFRVLLAALLAVTIAAPAAAQTPNFDSVTINEEIAVGGARLAPTVESNTQLSALSTVFVKSVTRVGFAARGDSPAVHFTASDSACAANSGAGDGGLQVPSSDGKCWVAQVNGPIDMRIWGASCDDGDDTTAIQTAVRSALYLRWPDCSLTIAGTVTMDLAGVQITGSGTQSRAVTSSATASMFVINAVDIRHQGLLYTASVTRTGGSYISLGSGGGNFSIDNFSMYSWFKGISTDGGAIIGPTVSNGRLVQPAGPNSIGIDYNGSGANVVSVVNNVLCTGIDYSNQPSSCFRVRNVGDLTLRGVSTVYGGHGISVTPQNGQYVQALLISEGWIDSGNPNFGIYAETAGTGKIDLLRVADTWIATNNIGVLLSGNINETDIDNSSLVNNATHGVLVNTSSVSGTRVRGSTIAGNAGIGFVTAANASNITLAGNTIGASGQFIGNQTGGIVLGAEVSNTNIVNNVMFGNSGTILGYSTLGSNIYISGNRGVSPLSSGGTVCASPCTIAAAARPSTYYFRQAATNTATVAVGGNTIGTMTTPNLPVTVRLEPGESVVVTWSTTAPTYTLVEH